MAVQSVPCGAFGASGRVQGGVLAGEASLDAIPEEKVALCLQSGYGAPASMTKGVAL